MPKDKTCPINKEKCVKPHLECEDCVGPDAEDEKEKENHGKK